MKNYPKCTKCDSEHTYDDGTSYICPECGYNWAIQLEVETIEPLSVVKDANGNILQDGDSVTIIKDIKVKGSPSALKIGVKVKNIRLIEEVDGHNIEAKIPGFGTMMLKASIVKKSS